MSEVWLKSVVDMHYFSDSECALARPVYLPTLSWPLNYLVPASADMIRH